MKTGFAMSHKVSFEPGMPTQKQGTIKFTKIIPASLLNEYQNMGWVAAGTESIRPDELVVIVKSLNTKSGEVAHADVTFSTPYLIQRAKIKRPLNKMEGRTLREAVQLDYMGSAEFEFGALPLSLRRIQAQLGRFKIVKCDDIIAQDEKDSVVRTFVLRMYANFDIPEHEAQYKQWLQAIVEDKLLYLKERCELSFKCRGPTGKGLPEVADFWWDVKNDVMFSFDKIFMSRLEGHLKATFSSMDS